MKQWLLRLWHGDAPPAPPPVAQAPARKKPRPMQREHVAAIKGAPPQIDPFRATRPMPGVVPKGVEPMGMDSASVTQAYAWAQASGWGYYSSEGLTFLGYPYLAELTQRPEYRKPAEIIAKEMTRRWIRFTAAGTDDKSDKLKALTEAFERLGVRDAFRELSEKDGFYGRAHLFLDFGDARDPAELQTPLVVKAPKISPKRPLRAVRVVEPVWVYPNDYDSSNPMVASFYKPRNWFVMGDLVDSSRLLTLVSRAVPDLLKPAYVFGGLSLSQMLKPYVDNWLRTRQSVSDLISSFSKDILKTNLGAQLQDGAGWDTIIARAEAYIAFRDNRNLTLLDKDSEDFVTLTTPLSSLDKLQAQAQEQMAGIAGIPLVVLFGITPSGLNASSDGEMRAFYAWVKAQQEDLYRGPLTYVSRIVQLSEFGEIDESISFEFLPLWEPTETEAVANAKVQADTDAVYVEAGVVDTSEVRDRLASQQGSPYYGLDTSVQPEPPETGDVPHDPDDGDPPAQDAEWKEGDHPRAENGQFGSGGGGASHTERSAHHASEGERLMRESRAHRAEGRVREATEAMSLAREHMAQANHHTTAQKRFEERGGAEGEARRAAERQRRLAELDYIPAASFNAAEYARLHDKFDVTVDHILEGFPPETSAALAGFQANIERAPATVETFRDAEGNWTPERQEVHNRIIAHVLNEDAIKRATPADGEKPTFTVLGGRGGSGKSKLKGVAYDPNKAIVLDPDEIKGMLPEYEGWNAAQVHEESGEIFDAITEAASAAGLNLVHDATLRSPEKAVKTVSSFRDRGYRIEAHYMHLPRQEAAKRAVERTLRSGRYVPPAVVLDNTKNEESFERIKGLADVWSFRDNNVPEGSPPKLISESGK